MLAEPDGIHANIVSQRCLFDHVANDLRLRQ
jgi:hypothetical protein